MQPWLASLPMLELRARAHIHLSTLTAGYGGKVFSHPEGNTKVFVCTVTLQA